MTPPLDIVIIGLALRSSWGNAHANTYRALVTALLQRGHRVLFLERDLTWYAGHQDLSSELSGDIAVYADLEDLADCHGEEVAQADLVIVGSCVPDGIQVGDWVQGIASGVVAFYDIDTPLTLASLARGDCPYLHPRQIPGYDIYLSFSGGRSLQTLEQRFGSPLALPLYCSVDPQRYRPEAVEPVYDLGYVGTYSDDRQPVLDQLLLQAARAWPHGRFVVAGPQYPEHLAWPANVERIEHLEPAAHPRLCNQQRYALNVTRADMAAAGWSPSARLFEAAACATPIVSDPWEGLDIFFEPGREILIARSTDEVMQCVRDIPEDQRRAIGEAGRRRVLAEHTAAHRVRTLERHFESAMRFRGWPWAAPKPSAASIPVTAGRPPTGQARAQERA